MAAASSLARRKIADKKACKGPGVFWGKVLDTTKGHQLVLFTGRSGTLAGCSTCGCYAFLDAVGLLQQCTGFMTKARAGLWNKLCSGYHPYTGIRLGEPQPLITLIRAATADQAEFIEVE